MEWIVRFVRFHRLRSRAARVPAAATLEACLTAVAGPGHGAAATQHQAMHALVCRDTRVLNPVLEGRLPAGRADNNLNGPVVMTRDDGAAVLVRMDGTPQRVATVLDGSG